MGKKKKTAKKKAATPAVKLSPKDYGERRGVSRQAVMRAIADGRLRDSVTKNDRGWNRLDPDLADEEWNKRTDPSGQEGAREKAGGRPSGDRTGALFEDDEPEGKGGRVPRLATARRERLEVDTELRLLELEERRGRLIDRQAADREFFRIGRELRDALLRIPNNLAAELASQKEPAEVERRLVEELAKALEVARPPEEREP